MENTEHIIGNGEERDKETETAEMDWEQFLKAIEEAVTRGCEEGCKKACAQIRKEFMTQTETHDQCAGEKELKEPEEVQLKSSDCKKKEKLSEGIDSKSLPRDTICTVEYLSDFKSGLSKDYGQDFSPPLTVFEAHFLSAAGDLLDLIPSLFSHSAEVDYNVLLGGRVRHRWDMGHCSALIKVLPGYENIYFAHSSWFTYAATLRIYKHWDFKIDNSETRSGRASFSSYPGTLASMDDFYILGNGLIMLQTTNSVFNQSLLKQVVPESLFAWQRVRLANMMADSGKTWAQMFAKQNSGTYNNQYMVLDTNKITLQKCIDNGALYVIEQIPKHVEYSDQTNILRKGYWPSYNIPFHETIYNMSGYRAYVTKYGLDFSYDMAPRAKIFRRDQGSVTDMATMKRVMRYNNYKKDPYARHNPCNTICCREDLNLRYPTPAGCYDSKVSDIYMAAKFTAYAINGPPVEEGLPVFSWSRFNQTKHQGLPDSYNFDFITMKPVL
ncbi:PREDICTED: phospholipase-B 81-like [Gekko japonicus]|uniref:Phospholipase B-like n=1 Tax=Gekko japonicus TaxID=146911 RepID=A0ABM1KNC2_GEKJA|nr:PREDICTED: phospholipase-B 81-like [Gekko japonicus]